MVRRILLVGTALLTTPALADTVQLPAPITVSRNAATKQYGVANKSLAQQITAQVALHYVVDGAACQVHYDTPPPLPLPGEDVSPDPENIVPADFAGTATVNGTVVLTYNGNVNKSGSPTGNGFYEGSVAQAPTVTVADIDDGELCPSGGTVIRSGAPYTYSWSVYFVSWKFDSYDLTGLTGA